jgi:hypothetical protein
MAFGHPFKRGHRPGKTDSTSSLGLIDQSMSRWVEYMHTLEKSVQTHPNAQKCYKDSTGLAHPGGPRGQRPLHWHRDQAAGIHMASRARAWWPPTAVANASALGLRVCGP